MGRERECVCVCVCGRDGESSFGTFVLSLNTHLLYGSSAKAFCIQSTAPSMSDSVMGETSIAILI